MRTGLNIHLSGGRYFGARYHAEGALSKPDVRHEHYTIQAGPGVVDVLPDELDDLIVRLEQFRGAHKEVAARGS